MQGMGWGWGRGGGRDWVGWEKKQDGGIDDFSCELTK